jgi:hypothetical protein
MFSWSDGIVPKVQTQTFESRPIAFWFVWKSSDLFTRCVSSYLVWKGAWCSQRPVRLRWGSW